MERKDDVMTPMDTNWPGFVPSIQSCIWSTIARAADKALDAFRALIIAAPLCWISGMKSVMRLSATNQSLYSGNAWLTGTSLIVACATSGN